MVIEQADVHSVRNALNRAAQRYVVRLTSEDLEDLVQETFLWLLMRRNSKRIRSRRAYAARTAHNVFVDSLRRKTASIRDERITVPIERPRAASSEACPERTYLGREELMRRLDECRSVLTERPYEVFELSYVHGLNGAEVADVCGIAPSTVHGVLYHVRLKLADAGIVVSR